MSERTADEQSNIKPALGFCGAILYIQIVILQLAINLCVEKRAVRRDICSFSDSADVGMDTVTLPLSEAVCGECACAAKLLRGCLIDCPCDTDSEKHSFRQPARGSVLLHSIGCA